MLDQLTDESNIGVWVISMPIVGDYGGGVINTPALAVGAKCNPRAY